MENIDLIESGDLMPADAASQEGQSNVGGLSQTKPKSKIEPLEIAMSDDDDDDDDDDMESLLHQSSPSNGNGMEGDIEHGHNNNGSHCRHRLKQFEKCNKTYLNGWIRPQTIGNMHILFPDYFHSSSWGVLGPHWFGPACVWLILAVATHFCLKKAHHIGLGSVIMCYCFLAICTYLLTDVSFRDPGICLDKEIPGEIAPSEASQWRWCDFCQVYQPPDGAHCPDCNICVAGYDHHCVWMGTCIGRKNYRQFIKFNMSWLYYVGFLFFWLSTFGPLMVRNKDS